MAIALTLTRSLLSPSLSNPLSISTARKLTLNTQLRRRTTSGDFTERSSRVWRIFVANGDALPAPEASLEKVQELVPVAASNQDITPTVISGLLFLAFIALSVLTIGVVYLAVQDFLQKRETEKFEKAEEERMKNEMKKKKRKKRRTNW
ncbi:hypothetical protein LUZ60_012939 [Juncus effusus]|nr:hypothetical protein LUZ60_012939 [Juncus effusus]